MKIMLIGGGHRVAFFIRVAKAYPEQFQVACAFIRNPNKAAFFEKEWGIKAYSDFEQMVQENSVDYSIVAINPDCAPEYIQKLAALDIPILCETPPATTLEGLNELSLLVKKGARIQVSEQYNNVPLQAARLNAIKMGLIGTVHHAQVSVAHDYHGLSLLRHYLGIGFENARVTAVSLKDKLLDGPTRYNTYMPAGESMMNTNQQIAIFDWGDRSGVYDFEGDQYASWVRRQHVLVRGEKGEIADEEVRVLLDSQTPAVMPLQRMDTHEYDYMYLHGYTVGNQWVYKNQYLPKLNDGAMQTYYGRVWDFSSTYSRFTDDEIAVADVMMGMNEYVRTGKSFYSFAEGAQDQYLKLVIDQALASGKPVMMTTQDWAK